MKDGLKSFYELTLRDPLFAAQGLDLINAAWALGRLEEAADSLEQVLRKKNRWFCFWYPFRHTLHPVSFLKSFLDSEKKRRLFLSRPSLENAEALLKSHRATSRALEADLKAYREALLGIQQAERFSSETAIQYFDNMITFREVLASVDVMLENARLLGRELKEREKILKGEKTAAFFPKNREMPDISKFMPVKFEGPALRPDLREIHESKEKRLRFVERYGPIFYTSALFDEAEKTHQFFVYVLKDRESEQRQLEIVLADQYFFLDLDEMRDKFFLGMSIYQPLIKRGIRYWNQPSTAWYSVFDLAYWADLSAAADLTWRRPFLDRERVLFEKSSMLDLLLETGANYDELYVRLAKIMAKANELPSLIFTYVARGYPSLYYLPFNKSVWRLETRPNFTGTRFGEGSHYKKFDEIKDTLSREALLEVFKGGAYRNQDFNAELNDS